MTRSVNGHPRLLGQLRPSNTTAVSLFSPGRAASYLCSSIVVCNVGSAAAKFNLYHDNDGSTYDETTALVWEARIKSGETVLFEAPISCNLAAGNVGVKTNVGSALNFTCYGYIEGEAV